MKKAQKLKQARQHESAPQSVEDRIAEARAKREAAQRIGLKPKR